MVAKRFAKTIYCYNNIDGRRCIAQEWNRVAVNSAPAPAIVAIIRRCDAMEFFQVNGIDIENRQALQRCRQRGVSVPPAFFFICLITSASPPASADGQVRRLPHDLCLIPGVANEQ